jgi:uncharacterized membrane protein required for colicin V production
MGTLTAMADMPIFPSSGWSAQWTDYVSLIYYGVIVLFILIGIFRGALRTFFSAFNFFVAITAGVLLGGYIGKWLEAGWMSGPASSLSGSIYNWLSPKITNGTQVVTKENILSGTNLSDALNSIHLSYFLDFMTNFITNHYASGFSQEAAKYFSDALTEVVFVAASGLIVFLIIYLILTLINKKILKAQQNHPTLKSFDRILGALFGAVYGAVILVSFSYTLNAFMGIEAVSNWVQTAFFMDAGHETTWSLPKMLYMNNYLQKILNMIVK